MKNRYLPSLFCFLFFSILSFNAQGQLVINGPTSVCYGCYTYSVTISPNTQITPPYAFLWSVYGSNGISYTSTEQSPTLCFDVNGIYEINLQVYDATGKTFATEIEVFVSGSILVDIISLNTTNCNTNQDSTQNPNNYYCEKVCPYSTVTYTIEQLYDSLIFTDPAVASINWNVVGAESYTVNPPYNYTITVNWGPSGAGSVSAVVYNFGPGTTQCSGEDALCVTIIEEPKAQFTTDPAPPPNDTLRVCKGQTVYFENTSQDADSYAWLFTDDGSTTGQPNPQHTYHTPGFYTVQLIARSACLCADTTQKIIEVLDAEAPVLDCIGDVCPGATVSYTASANCTGINWAVSSNGTVLDGGTVGADSITVQWGAGPAGTITLSNFSCSANTCPQPTIVRIPIIDDNAEIRGAEEVCPDAEEVYSIEAFGGTGFVWSLSGGGSILEGQGTNRVSIHWNGFPNPNTINWLVVRYDNCNLGCGGIDSIPVRIVSPFFVDGPLESCQNSNGDFSARLIYNNQLLDCNWTLFAPDGSVAWTSPGPASQTSISFANGPGIYRIFLEPNDPTQTCTAQQEWAVQVPDLPAGPSGIDGATLICPGSAFTYEATGLTPGASVRWVVQNGPAAPDTIFGNPVNVSWNASGPYQLTAVRLSDDGLGCPSDPIQLNLQVLGSLILNGPVSTCADAKLNYSAPLIPGLNYQWTVVPANAGTIASGQGTNQVQVFWQLPGNHQIQLDVCGKTANRAVTVFGLPDPAVNHPAGLCPGATATVQTASPYASYSWGNAGGGALGNTPTINLGPGDYVVTVTDANGCSGNSNFGIDPYPNPNLTVSTPDPTAFCANSRFVTMHALVSSGGPLSYEWFQDGTPLGVNAAQYTTNQYGQYTVQATNSSGCSATAGPINIVEDCGGGSGFPCTPRPPCPPGTANLQIDPSARCDSMYFSLSGPAFLVGSGSWAFVQSGATSIGTVFGDETGFVFPEAGYYIIAAYAELTDGTLCRIIDSITVEAVAQFTPLPECPGIATDFDESSAFMPGSGISAWTWDFGDPASGVNNSSALRVPMHVYTPGGNFTVTLTVTANSGCTASASETIAVPVAAPPAITPPVSFCAENALEFSATGKNLSWDFGDPASGNLNSASGQNVYHSFAAGNYLVTATAEDDFGCTTSTTEPVNISPNSLSGLINPSNPAPICENSNLILEAPPGGQSYLWSDNSTNDSLIINQEGIYSVTLTDANGCTFAPPPVSVDVLPGPDALIKALLTNEFGQPVGVAYPSHTVCAGDDVRLFAEGQGNYTYSWSTGATSLVVEFTKDRFNLLPVGTHVFTVTVTDVVSGCTSVTAPFVVKVNPVPSGFSISNSTFPPCAESTNTLTYNGPNPGNWQFIWNNGETDLPLVTENPGKYVLRVINEYGCEAQSNALTVLPGPNVGAIPAGCHTRCRPDTLCLPAIPYISSWQWYFNGNPVPGATSPTFVPDQSGTYYAELTDWFGCTNESGPLTLNLLDGYGNILGQVWSDVNGNGVIDGADTLVNGIPVQLVENSTPVAAVWSGAGGGFAFTNVLSTNYSVEIEPSLLPAGWQIIIGQDPVSLSGCDAEGQVGLLLQATCLNVFTSTVDMAACPSASVLYNGVNIPAGNSQVFTFTTADGCDSLVTVNVGVLPVSSATLNVSACAGTDYDYNGTMIPAGTSQQFMLQNYLGCDSVLTVNVGALPTSAGTLDVSACPGTDYDYNGTMIPAGTSQQFMLQNYLGCDSVLTVNVGTLPTSAGTLDVSACPGTDYDYNGTMIPAGTSQQFMLQNYLGCDSVLTVNVGTLPTSTGTLDVSACPGTDYDYNGTMIPAGTSQQFMLQNYLGCDSVLTVNVGMLPTSTGTLDVSACPGTDYDYNGTMIPAGTSQQFMLQNYLGCDSVLTVNVGMLPTSTGTLDVSACPGTDYDYNGTMIPAGTSQQFMLQNYLGCDSVLTVNVGVSPTSSSNLAVQLCPGETYPYQGSILQIGDTQAFTLQNVAGCDSVVTVSVTGLNTSTETQQVSVCPGQSFTFDGVELQIGETQTFTYTNSEGCDSTVIVVVIGFPSAAFDLSAKASCHNIGTGELLVTNPSGGLAPYRYSLDGLAFQDALEFDELLPGSYTVWLEDSNGCLFENQATIPSLTPLTVELNDALLPCDANGIQLSPLVGGDLTNLNYNWSTGAQTAEITVFDAGDVWVEVQNQCETQRREIAVNWADVGADFSFVYLPNVFAPQSSDPDNSQFKPYFATGLNITNYKLEVFDRWGNKVFGTTDMQEGWTGPFRDERMQPAVFVWYMFVDIDFCGRIHSVRKEGDVTVVR